MTTQTPGEKIGQAVRAEIDRHFVSEIKSYCLRHPQVTHPDLEVVLAPKGKDTIRLTLQPKDQMLILPKRKWELTIRLKGKA